MELCYVVLTPNNTTATGTMLTSYISGLKYMSWQKLQMNTRTNDTDVTPQDVGPNTDAIHPIHAAKQRESLPSNPRFHD